MRPVYDGIVRSVTGKIWLIKNNSSVQHVPFFYISKNQSRIHVGYCGMPGFVDVLENSVAQKSVQSNFLFKAF
jgi:hypothetical protein